MPTVIHSFLEVIHESEKVASTGLSSFMDYVRPQLPDLADEIQKELASFYFGCVTVFEQSMIGNGLLASKADAISHVELRSLHNLFAAFHTCHVMMKGIETDGQGYAWVHMDGVVALYQKHPSYAESWLGFLQNNRKSEAFAEELLHRVYDEICIVMRGNSNDLSEALFWGDVIIDADRCARSFYESTP